MNLHADTNSGKLKYFNSFFLVVYLSLALNSPVKIYSLIDANEKLHYIDIAKYTGELTMLQWNFLITYFIHKFHNTSKFFTRIWFYYKKNLILGLIPVTGIIS